MLRRQHALLAALPDAIKVPISADVGRGLNVVPLDAATVDDVALAIRVVAVEFDEVGDRLHALQKLYSLARQAGALGAERIAVVVLHGAGGA